MTVLGKISGTNINVNKVKATERIHMCDIGYGKVTETESCSFEYGNLLCVGVHIYGIGCIRSCLSTLAQRRTDMTGLSLVSPE